MYDNALGQKLFLFQLRLSVEFTELEKSITLKLSP